MSIIHDALKKLERERRQVAPPEPQAPQVPSNLSPVSFPEKSAIFRKWHIPTFSYKGNLLGVDIGSSSIKVVRLKRRGGGYRLAGVGYAKMQPGISRKGISEVLKTLLKVEGIGGRRAASAMAGESLTFSHVRLPKMPKRDLDEAVRWEVKKGIGFPDEAVIDYVVNDEIREEGKTMLSILAFAVRREEVLEHAGILRGASLIPDAIDVYPMALLSAFDYNYASEKGKRYAILDIGASKTTLAVVSSGSLRFTRQIPLGGNDITKIIQDAEGIDFNAAEEMKVRHAPQLDASPEVVQNAVKSFIEGISQELRRSFKYYQAQVREGDVKGVLVAGGCSRIKGIAGHIENALGVPTSLYDATRGVKGDTGGISRLSPVIAVAFGLALRREGD
jgi:type IV pilus assembly protein PilM